MDSTALIAAFPHATQYARLERAARARGVSVEDFASSFLSEWVASTRRGFNPAGLRPGGAVARLLRTRSHRGSEEGVTTRREQDTVCGEGRIE
jgi:hypothetical protein